MSFAVNDRPGVSSETRERILAAARELGWRPSASARALTEARTRAIGLVLARDAAQLEVDAFFVRFLSGIERALTAADYALLLQLVPGEAPRGAARLRAARRRRARGRVPADRRRGRRPALRAARGGRRAGRARRAGRRGACPFPWVETRHDEGMAPPVEHLAALGHERIAFFGGRADFEHVQVREARWRAALAGGRAGAGPAGRTPTTTGARRRSRCWPSAPTAVVCASDALAMAVVVAAREARARRARRRLGDGFDDSPLAAFGRRALTSVRVDYAEFGAAAAARCWPRSAVAGGERVYSPSPPELVVREPRPRAAAR